LTENELSNLSQSILEIIAEHRDTHILLVKGQLQKMNRIIGLTIKDTEFNEAIQSLVDKGLIKELESKSQSYILTSEGKKLV
jgi:predicted transcriptional regulator